MKRTGSALVALALLSGAAFAQDTLKVAVPQRGAWDAGIAELGRRGGVFKKHGLDLETAAGVSAAVGTFAKCAPIRIIGNEVIGSPDLYWYVPASSPDRKV